MANKTNRTFDIVVWGATGFTGTLITEYLFEHGPEKLKWAIAGRNQGKLQKVMEDVVKTSRVPDKVRKAQEVPILIGSLSDQESIDEIIKKTKVLLSSAGPYTFHGTPIIDACARLGTDYCDLTGETTWIRKVAAAYDEQARRTGAILVNSCGFDSIPNDLGTLMVADYVKEKYGCVCESVKCIMTKFAGGVSGGTLASVMAVISTVSPTELRDPYYLVPDGGRKDVRQPIDQMTIAYDHDVKVYKYPYVLGPSENRFVRRSQFLLGYKYGNFKFSACGGTKSFFVALISTVVTLITFILVQFKIARWVISKVVPPGSGPSKSSLPKGGFSITIVAEPEKKPGVPKTVTGRVSARGDPGYYVTALMISECALCLATQRDELPAKSGGVLTPSSSMGVVLLDRLRKAGMLFEVEENVA